MLLNPALKMISNGALEQFHLDLMQCELFTSQCPIPGFDDVAALTMTFAHVSQLLDLILNNDWTNYLASRGQRTNKYSRVKASYAATLLEKFVNLYNRKLEKT